MTRNFWMEGYLLISYVNLLSHIETNLDLNWSWFKGCLDRIGNCRRLPCFWTILVQLVCLSRMFALTIWFDLFSFDSIRLPFEMFSLVHSRWALPRRWGREGKSLIDSYDYSVTHQRSIWTTFFSTRFFNPDHLTLFNACLFTMIAVSYLPLFSSVMQMCILFSYLEASRSDSPAFAGYASLRRWIR